MRTKLSTGVTLLIATGLSGAMLLSALPANAEDAGADPVAVFDAGGGEDPAPDSSTPNAPADPRTSQVIFITPIPDQMIGQFAEVSAQAAPGLPVTFVAAGSCQILPTGAEPIVVATTAGVCTITASQPGNAQYAPAGDVSISFNYVQTPAEIFGEIEDDGIVGRGTSVTVLVGVNGTMGDTPRPTGDVSITMEGAMRPADTATLDSKGRAALSFKAPKTTGDYDLKVRYPGDAAYVGSRESDLVLHVVNNPKARAGSTEISLKGPAATILDGDDAAFTLTMTPPNDGSVAFTWPGHAGESVVKTNGASALTFKTDQLHPGTYDVTAKFTYVDNGRAYEGTDSVSVTVDAQDSGKFDLWDSSASLGVRVDLNGTPSPVAVEAPKVSIVVGVPTLVRVAGLTPGVKWLVRVRESVKGKDTWVTKGYVTPGADGVTILPPLNAKVVGEGLVRLVPAAGDPVYVRVDATRAERPPVDWSDPDTQRKSAVLKLLKTLTVAAAEKIPYVGKGVGWLAGFLIGSLEDPAPDIQADILKAVQDSNKKLDAVSAQITNLTQTVQLSQCEISTALSSSAVSRITRLQATYRNLIKSGAKGSDAWDTWVRDVLSDTSGAGEAATELHTYLVRGNALKACAKAYKDRWDGTYDGTRTLNYPQLGESLYYQAVWDYLDGMQAYQVLALNMVTEANHVKAVQAWDDAQATDPSHNPKPFLGVDRLREICTYRYGSDQLFRMPAKTASPAFYCNQALSFTRDVYSYIAQQTLLAGVGFSMNPAANGNVSIQQGNPDLLWVTDISKYGDRSACQDPTAASSTLLACGPTVGTTEPFSGTSATSYGYTGWRAASTADWTGVLKGDGNTGRTVKAAMERAGFFATQPLKAGETSAAQPLIIYTGEAVPATDPSWTWWAHGSPSTKGDPIRLDDQTTQGMCLLDTAMTIEAGAVLPLCRSTIARADRQSSLPFLLNHAVAGPVSYSWGTGTQDWMWEPNRKWGGWSNEAYYSGQLKATKTASNGIGHFQRAVITRFPGWMFNNAGQTATAEFRWPVLNLKSIGYSCKPVTLGEGADAFTFTPTEYNVAGARSMCSDDFAAWLRENMPNPPAKEWTKASQERAGGSGISVRTVAASDVGTGLTINEFNLSRSTIRSGMKLTAEVVARAPSGVRNVDLIVTDRYGDVTDPGDDAPMQYDLCHGNEMRLVSGTAPDGRWKLTCKFAWDPGVYWLYPAVCSNEQKCVYGVEEDQDMVLELTVRR